MIRSSSRKVKPTTKFEEFRMTASTGKKRGRPRKHFDNYDPTTGRMLVSQPCNDSINSIDGSSISMKHGIYSVPKPKRSVGRPPRSSLSQPQQSHPGRPRIEAGSPNDFPGVDNLGTFGASNTQTSFSTPQTHEPRMRPAMSRKEEMIRLREENESMKAKIDQIEADYENLKNQSSYTGLTVPKVDFDELKEQYQRDITFAKRHEWCSVCLAESKYYCCWNTTYCSQKCQISDWYAKHGYNCERRRAAERKAANK